MVVQRNRNSGFTLIELLVVIAIIGLLSSVVLASLNSARAKSRDARRYSDFKQLQLALELYYDSNRSYPVTGWRSVCTGYTTSGSTGWIPNLAPNYIPILPTDPSGCVGGAFKGYIYMSNSNGTDFKVATDWSADIGDQCGKGKGFYDVRCGENEKCTFCSVYTSGALNW